MGRISANNTKEEYMIKKIICLTSIVFILLVLVSCNTYEDDYYEYDYSYSYEEEDYDITKSEAIALAQESSKVESVIANKCGILFPYSPDYGTCTADDCGDYYYVYLKGNISGYTDEYKSNYVYDEVFSAKVRVDKDGYVGAIIAFNFEYNF